MDSVLLEELHRYINPAAISSAGRSGNLKVAGSSLDPVGLISDRVKPMTLKLILVASEPGAWHY